MTQALLLSALLLLTASSANARPAPRGGKISTAQNQFNRGDFSGALETLQGVEAEATDDATLAKAKLLEAQCYGAQRDFGRAEEAFAGALTHDPEVRLDPAKVDPDLVKLLEGVRDRLRGELRVSTDRSAKVFLDGKPLGGTPLKTSVSIGRHTVEARGLDGRSTASQQVVVAVRKPVELSLTLEERADSDSGASSGNAPSVMGPGLILGFGRPLADLRMGLDPFQFNEGVHFEVGGGLESQYLRFSLHARVFPFFGITPRGALTVPVDDHFRGYISLELPILFNPNGLSIGLGGAGGAEYVIGKWIGIFFELGARHFFLAADYYDGNRLTLQAGARLHIP